MTTEEDFQVRLELGRLDRLRRQLAAADCDAGIFYDPINIRYATGTSNMSVYSLHNPCRYVFVPVEGPVVLFDFKGCGHLSRDHPAVGEVRDAVSWYHFITGDRSPEFANRWADEIAELLGAGSKPSVRRGCRVAVDRLDPYGLDELRRRNIEWVDGQAVANRAKAVKSAEEITVMNQAMEACEAGIAEMAKYCEPGITEQQLWAVLHKSNIEAGGEWFETRLLTSGPRTNPWYQECSDRLIEPGDLVAFDTDLIGIGGYSIDISRTWLAGDRAPTGDQRRMYSAAYQQLSDNIALLSPGLSFREFAMKATVPPDDLHSPTNACLAHGVGMCNEYPLILNRDLFDSGCDDGTIEVGMVLCVESLVAPVGGSESVKLEEQVLITENGPEVLSRSPFSSRLLG